MLFSDGGLGRGYKVEYWQVFHPPCQIEYQIRFVHSPGRLTNKEKPGLGSAPSFSRLLPVFTSKLLRAPVSGCWLELWQGGGSSWSKSNFDVNSIWQPGTERGESGCELSFARCSATRVPGHFFRDYIIFAKLCLVLYVLYSLWSTLTVKFHKWNTPN